VGRAQALPESCVQAQVVTMTPIRILFRFLLTAIASFFLSVFFSVFSFAPFSGLFASSQAAGSVNWGLLLFPLLSPGLATACAGYLVAGRPWAACGRWAGMLPWLALVVGSLLHLSTRPALPEVLYFSAFFGCAIFGAFFGGDLGDRKRKEWERMCENLRQRVEHHIGEG
jgi:hypothetical protein